MSIKISLQDPQPIQFGLTGAAEIVQNIRMILSTLQGTMPLARGFGIDSSMIDEPIPIQQARLSSAVIAAVLEYEPRVTVTGVTFREDSQSGRLLPIVHIEPAGGEVLG